MINVSEATSYFNEILRGYSSTRKLRFQIVLHLMSVEGDYASNIARLFNVNKKTVENILKRLENVGLLNSYWDIIEQGGSTSPKAVKRYIINSAMSYEDHVMIRDRVEQALEDAVHLFPF